MSDSKCTNTSLLEDVISSKNDCVFICDLNALTLQIISDAWWTAMIVNWQLSVAGDNSGYAPSWRV
jgi:hypothetical protein